MSYFNKFGKLAHPGRENARLEFMDKLNNCPKSTEELLRMIEE
jgi:hypothetical protein